LIVGEFRRAAITAIFFHQHRKSGPFLTGKLHASFEAVPSKADLLQDRAERFAVRVLKFIRTLPQTPEGDSLRRQLARSAPGISGNYRSARRGRSKAEFTARLGVAVDEADETERWLMMVKNSGLASGSELDWLIGESGELRAIYVASYGTARRNGRT